MRRPRIRLGFASIANTHRGLTRYWPIFFLAITAILPIWRALFLGEVIGPVDQIRTMAPWNGPAASQPWDVLQADAILQFAPWRHMVLDAWSKGQMPFWNPHQLMGTPLLANSQSAGLYPFHILLGVFRIPATPAIAILAWLHLFIAGLGVFHLSQRMGASKVGSTVAGVSFTLSAFMLAWTVLPSVITTVSWLPWILSFIIGIFHASPFWDIFAPVPNSESDSAEHALQELASLPATRAKCILGLAASTAMMMLGGHLQFSAFGLLAAATVVVVLGLYQAGFVVWKGKGRLYGPALAATAACALGIGIGALLAAPQVLPTLQFSRHSHRMSPATSQGYEAYSAGAIQPYELAGLVFPTLLGHPLESNEVIPGATSFWPAYAKPGANFAESALSLGPFIFLLLWLIPRRRFAKPESVAIASVAVLGLLVALGTPLNRLFYFLLPGWSATGSPGRAGLLFVLAGCTLASLALSSGPVTLPKPRRLGLGLVLAALTAALPYYMAKSLPDPFGLGPVLEKLTLAAVASGGFAILVSLALSAVAVLVPLRSKRGPTLALAAVFISMTALNWKSPIPTGEPLLVPSSLPAGRFAAINGDWQLLVRSHALLPPNTASLFGLDDVAGYDSLLDRDTKAALDAANGRDSAPAANGNMLLVGPSAGVAKLAQLGVDQVWSSTPIPGLREAAGSGSTYIYQTGGSGRFDNQGRPHALEIDGYDRQSLTASGPGILTIRDRNMDGWTVRIDGRQAVIPSGFFRTVKLEPGSHRIEFRYVPPGFAAGIRLFVLGIVWLALLMGLAFGLPFDRINWRRKALPNSQP